jgi:tetratricopeptide (TPR) repeat protein
MFNLISAFSLQPFPTPMPVISSIFLVIALVLAVVVGPQTRPWTWGPAMAVLGLAVLAAVPSFWKRGKAPADFGWIAMGALTAAWFAWRAWVSPVVQLGQADLLLVGGAVGAFVSIRAIAGNALAERILVWGVALLLSANVLVIGQQITDPGFSPVFRMRGVTWPSGFFAVYNEAANYLIASSMLVGGAAIFGRHSLLTRMLWLLIAIAGLAGVWFTRSRGGILGAAVACGVFAVIALMIGKRRNARWFAPALIAIPVMGMVIGAFLIMGWQDAQAKRLAGSGIERLLDNDCRLYFLGTALSCIHLHPLVGGGSRSFSWECFRFLDGKTNGHLITLKPEVVHNELVQSATDYGLAGTGLLVGLLGALALAAVLRVLFEETPQNRDAGDAWRIGALAGLAGMLVQSCFTAVFHMLPGILLLGICLGQLSRSAERSANMQTLVTRSLLVITALSCVVLLIPAGWKGIQVTRILWPTHFSKQITVSAESRIDALSEAIALWPQSAFYQERAAVFQTSAGTHKDAAFREPAQRAIDDYQEASQLHPFDPALAVNRANLLSLMPSDSAAEECYAKAIELQGGMEPAFRSHFSCASHYLRKGLRQFRPEDPGPAHAALERSAEQIEMSVRKMHWVLGDMTAPRVAIHENLGRVREAVGDRDGALESYNFAVPLPGGAHVHYRAAVVIGKMAVAEWSQRRPAAALTHFMEARKRLVQAGNALPVDVTPGQRAEFLGYLDRMIAFLIGAKTEPAK